MSQEDLRFVKSEVTTADVTLEIPPECKIVLYNDNFTTKEFVVEILVALYRKSESEAVKIMETAHNEGCALIGIYTYDIAVTLVELTRARARKNGFPLRVEVES